MTEPEWPVPQMNAVSAGGAIEPAHFRRVMGRFATGVTVVAATHGSETRGMTANAFISGSLNPPLCVVSIAKRAHMHGHLIDAGCFSVNVLAAGQEDLATHFAGRAVPGLKTGFTEIGGYPTIAGANAVITATVEATHDCGDHTLVIGHIRSMAADQRPPLLYHGGRFAALVPLREATPSLPEFW